MHLPSGFFFMFFFLMFRYNFSINIDTQNFIVYVDPQKDNISSNYFGYSVLLYPGNKKGTGKWIKIGAPKGSDPNINGFKNPGVVYDCPFMKKCRLVNIKRFFDEDQILKNAWIGGSMDISYKFQRLVICGFRTIFIQSSIRDYNMIGACYLSDLNDKFKEITPLKSEEHRLYTLYYNKQKKTGYDYGQGEAGFAAHFVENENVLLLGAPGVYNWKGTVVKIANEMVDDPEPSRLISKRYRKSFDDRTYVANLSLSNFNYAYDLFGYSITSGHYFSRKKLYYAVSTPKYFDYKGKVGIVEFKNGVLEQRTYNGGKQFGEYFGASTTSGDINTDGFDDLIVGAPFHSISTYNEGAVYILLGRNGQGQLKEHCILYGQNMNGQFGSAVMFLGDINNDNYGDVAIGAPYEEEFSGALYIYNGNKEGIDQLPSQRIVGRDIVSEIRGFGISISRPADIDENGYKDLVVGSHLSGNAVLLRTNPIVVVEYEMNTIPNALKRDSTNFFINICYKFTHFKNESLEINRTIIVDKLLGRAVLRNRKNYMKTIIIHENGSCENITVFLKNTKNHESSITVSLDYILAEPPKKKKIVYISEKYIRGRDDFCVRCPVLDKIRSTLPIPIKVPFILDCGDDNICDSELMVNAFFPGLGDNRYVVGSNDTLDMSVIIENSKEHAYSTQLEITLPDIVTFQQFPSECFDENVMTVIVCNTGDPLRKNSKARINVKLDMKKVNGNYQKTEINIILKIKTTSKNSNPDQNVLTLALARDTDIMISGKSSQQSFTFGNITRGLLNLTQIYQVEQIGVSPLEKVQVNITLPYSIKTSMGDVNFIKAFHPVDTFAGQILDCDSAFKFIKESNDVSDVDPDLPYTRRRRQIEVFNATEGKAKDDIVIEGKEFEITPEQTYYLNCSMENIICSSILCTIGPLEKGKAPVTIQVKLMFDSPAISQAVGEKSMIVYGTQGTATILSPTQNGNRMDFVEVRSLLINETVQKRPIALWIIILAAIIGILLLILIIYGLTKIGFFKRAKKEELKNLKAATQNLVDAESHPEPMDRAINTSTEGLIDDDTFVSEPTETPVKQEQEVENCDGQELKCEEPKKENAT